MQHRFIRPDGTRLQTDLVFTPIDSAHPSLLKLYEISHPNFNAQLRVQIVSIGFLDGDPDTNTGIVKFKYGERVIIELTFDLEDGDDAIIFYTIKGYKIMSTIFIKDNTPNADINTLIAIPRQKVAIAR